MIDLKIMILNEVWETCPKSQLICTNLVGYNQYISILHDASPNKAESYG